MLSSISMKPHMSIDSYTKALKTNQIDEPEVSKQPPQNQIKDRWSDLVVITAKLEPVYN